MILIGSKKMDSLVVPINPGVHYPLRATGTGWRGAAQRNNTESKARTQSMLTFANPQVPPHGYQWVEAYLDTSEKTHAKDIRDYRVAQPLVGERKDWIYPSVRDRPEVMTIETGDIVFEYRHPALNDLRNERVIRAEADKSLYTRSHLNGIAYDDFKYCHILGIAMQLSTLAPTSYEQNPFKILIHGTHMIFNNSDVAIKPGDQLAFVMPEPLQYEETDYIPRYYQSNSTGSNRKFTLQPKVVSPGDDAEELQALRSFVANNGDMKDSTQSDFARLAETLHSFNDVKASVDYMYGKLGLQAPAPVARAPPPPAAAPAPLALAAAAAAAAQRDEDTRLALVLHLYLSNRTNHRNDARCMALEAGPPGASFEVFWW